MYLDERLVHTNPFTIDDVDDLAKTLKLSMEPRNYQKSAVAHAITNKRAMLVSPTASGKSMIIYMLARYYPMKKLIIVPTTGLVAQLASDFHEYGYADDIHMITAGASKDIDTEITITTWQSIYKLPRKWFEQFQVVVGDEAHLFKAKSLTTIMSKLVDCPYKFGFTGTLDDSQTHKLVLEGLFGPVEKVVTTSELIEQKHLAELKINICILDHSKENKSKMARASYRDEVNYIIACKPRNDFLIELCKELKGNTLLLYALVEKHGKVLYDMAKELDRPIFFIHGGVSGEERNEVRAIVEKEERAIIVASYGTFSTGVNIRRLNNIVFASPSKSKIRVLQSIGRGLRKDPDNLGCKLYDIVDNLSKGKWVNYTARHYSDRVKLYNDEQFPYKVYTYTLKE